MARFTVTTVAARDKNTARLEAEGCIVRSNPVTGGYEILWCVPRSKSTKADEVLGSDRFYMNLPLTHPANAI